MLGGFYLNGVFSYLQYSWASPPIPLPSPPVHHSSPLPSPLFSSFSPFPFPFLVLLLLLFLLIQFWSILHLSENEISRKDCIVCILE
jgi:hypothetical protein